MAKGRRIIETVTALMLGIAIGYIPYISTSHAAQKITVQDMTKILKEMKVDPSPTVDCVALYDVIQAAQALYFENCPGP